MTTQVESLDKLQQYGRAQRVDDQVLNAIKAYGPMCRDAVGEITELLTSTMCGAIDRLKRRELIVEFGTTFNEKTRRNVTTYSYKG